MILNIHSAVENMQLKFCNDILFLRLNPDRSYIIWEVVSMDGDRILFDKNASYG